MTLITLLVLCFSILVLSGCTPSGEKTTVTTADKMVVATTFYPLYDLTQKIAGPDAEVYTLVPMNTEPHDFEPTPKEIARVHKASLYVALGASFAEFEEELIETLPSSVSVVIASKNVPLLIAEEEDNFEQEEKEEEHGLYDPHIWLSPKNAQIMAKNIKDVLVQKDPIRAATYEKNADDLLFNLAILDEEFRQQLSECRRDVILVNHNAFSYLAEEYGFRTVSVSGLEPEVEPSPGQIKALIDAANEHGIRYLFAEELVDSRVANTIAREVGAQVLVLSPVEGITDDDQDYFSLMRQNLNNLKRALECS